jgi:hypothetical protein
MAEKKAKLSLDYDQVWKGISRSTQVRDALQAVADELKAEAQRLAKQDAYDTGDYHDGIDVLLVPARQARQEFARGYAKRKKAGQVAFSSKFLDADTKGDLDGGAYDGSVAIIVSRSWKSWIIEFGSLARNPSFIFTRALESFRKQGVEAEVTYRGNVVRQNLEEWRKARGHYAVRIAGERTGTFTPDEDGGQA